MTATATEAAPDAEQPQAGESLAALALEEAALDLLAGRVAAAKKDVRARMQVALDNASRDGVDRVTATLPTGQTVASVSLRPGAAGPVVTDAEALARWVRATWPEQDWTTTRIVREVRPWKLAELLAQMEAAGACRVVVQPEQVNETTGELLAEPVVHDVPGVHWKPTRARTHALTWRKTGKQDTAEAWRNGALSRVMQAITSRPDDAK